MKPPINCPLKGVRECPCKELEHCPLNVCPVLSSTKEHLHLVREKKPDEKPEYKFVKVWCPHCDMWIWVIHLDLPPENPKEAQP